MVSIDHFAELCLTALKTPLTNISTFSIAQSTYQMVPGINNMARFPNGSDHRQQPVQSVQQTQQVPQVQQVQQNYRPLNVKDALSYLDQVKLQFRNNTDVYNKFLDIMKDFKSQSIDTPGVIDRVSALFKGHPKLIDGFNTFLPEGFSIECSTADPNIIVVTTPLGKSIRERTGPSRGAAGAAAYRAITSANSRSGGGSVSSTASYGNQPQISTPQQAALAAQGSPAEFDQAINYVNKIKQRYASRPEIYKHFLENLQLYQKGIKPIYDVYREISELFHDSPDLLEDFKLFMPDSASAESVAQPVAPAAPVAPVAPVNGAAQGYGYVQLPPVGSFAPPSSSSVAAGQIPQNGLNQADSTRRRLSSRGSRPQMQPGQPRGQLQPFDEHPVSNMRHQEEVDGYGAMAVQNQVHAENLADTNRQAVNGHPLVVPDTRARASLLPGVPEPVYPETGIDTDVSDEIAFFEKAKKAIGNRQTYNEFLKFLRLYTSDVIDKDTLVEKVEGFLGGVPELFSQFKAIVGWEAKPLRIENIAIRKQLMDLGMRTAAGPSYRLLPKSQTHKPCSGRDELCWEIFNDLWAGHPVWASEESGFIAHRKNQYEEIMYRIEDERHEYDYYMEANLRTIQTLETIANRLANMSPEEKARFKLPENLGHTSTTIYKKVIRKIYDKDRGWEVIDALRENPAVAVPVVLKRLKQKDEEWKRAHREWNKVWREAEQKIFYKSLDHLGLAFKQIDKKLLTNKQLVNEICTVKREQTHKRIHPLMPRPKSQLTCHYDDIDVLYDLLQLVCIYLQHTQSYSGYDKSRLLAFMRSFVVRFFFLDAKVVDQALRDRRISVDDRGRWNRSANSGSADGHDSSDVEIESSGESSGESTTSTLSNGSTLSQTRKRPREYDLLKDVLKRSKRSRRGHDDGNESEESDAQKLVDEALQKAQSSWINEESRKHDISDGETAAPADTEAASSVQSASERSVYNIFCNTQIYVFFRFIDTLYRRLLGVKMIAPAANREIKSRKETKFAKDLGLIDHSLEEQGVNIKGDDSYHEALNLCAKVIQGKVEQGVFEESLRQGFLNKAYRLFTINKVIQGLLKHCHTLVTDSKCGEILMLMEKDRNTSVSSAKDQMMYRMQVRTHMHSDENMFKISYSKKTKTAEIVFLAVDDLTIKDQSKSKEEKWNYYMTSYAMSYPTEGIDSTKVRMPFLESSLNEEKEDENEIEGVSDSKLKVKVDIDTYQLVFDKGSYDMFIRSSVYSKNKPLKDLKKLRLDSLRKNLDSIFDKKGDEEKKNAEEKFQRLLSEGQKAYEAYGKTN